jgi:hypothetical protein
MFMGINIRMQARSPFFAYALGLLLCTAFVPSGASSGVQVTA